MPYVAEDSLSGLNLQPVGKISCAVYSNENPNSSDKTFNLATQSFFAGSVISLRLIGIRVEFAATATIGTRAFGLEVRDSASDTIYKQNLNTGLNVTASDSQNFEMVPGADFVSGSEAREFLPSALWMRPDWKIRLFDTAAIDPSGDDMIVHIRALRLWL